jgi:NAD(P)-dependent dehydrogenase (short-subunit alcohol dehydrogenase family)
MKGKVVVITGASGGIGAAAAEEIAKFHDRIAGYYASTGVDA